MLGCGALKPGRMLDSLALGPFVGGGVGLRPTADVAEVARGYASLADADRRSAFLATLRSVIGSSGQRVDGAVELSEPSEAAVRAVRKRGK